MAIVIDGSSAAGTVNLGTNGTISNLAVGGVPDGTIDTDALAANAVTAAKAAGRISGITEADQWRITANSSDIQNGIFTANWERNDVNFAKIGTGLSQSSGVFSFPSTGIYYITYLLTMYANDTNRRYAGGQIMGTTDNGSNWVELAYVLDNAYDSGGATYITNNMDVIFDVTNTTNCKIRFEFTAVGTMTWLGNSNFQQSGFTCIRLGDT